MKLILPLLLTLLAACEGPQRTRLHPNYSSSPVNAPNNGATPGWSTTPTPTPTTTPGTPSTTPTTPVTPGFENCDLTPKYYSAATGYIGLCQSSANETHFRFVPSKTLGQKLCLIPTFKNTDGSSMWIGQPQCINVTEIKTYEGYLPKTRAGYQTATLNGVMVMLESTGTVNIINQYYMCMDGWATNFRQLACPNGATSQYCYSLLANCPAGMNTSPWCAQQASNIRANFCETFKSNYSSYYIDIRLK